MRGRLYAVIDIGCMGIGDPACDFAIAWTLLSGESRAAFRRSLQSDEGTWARGRGWALWKALITLAEYKAVDPVKTAVAEQMVNEVIADHRTGG
jgi:aminoglycoside phosphotransferase (APT) family kinase protein